MCLFGALVFVDMRATEDFWGLMLVMHILVDVYMCMDQL